MLKKMKTKLQYEKEKPLIYNEKLRKAYMGTSVTGGELKEKTVLITGGTGGIGIALALRFLYEGCYVIITGRDAKKLEDTLNYIKSKISNASIEELVIDLLDARSIDAGVKMLKNRDKFINILINNAGIVTENDKGGKFRTVTKKEFYDVWNINYEGTIQLTELIADEMQLRGTGGCIINIASICAMFKHVQYTPYGMSKAAIIQYTQLLREKYRSIVVHTISPGSVATSMNNIKTNDSISKNINVVKRLALPEEIAALSALLSGSCGNYIWNETIIASACEVL